MTPAIEGARARLKGLCLDYIKGNSTDDPIKVLDDLQGGGGVRYKSEDNAAGEIRWGGRGSGDTIFLHPYFFDPGPNHFHQGTRQVLNAEMEQQLIILHELRHALVGVHTSNDTSDDYDRNIVDFCFPLEPE